MSMRKRMTPDEAIAYFREELRHAEGHLRWKDQEPEYYEEWRQDRDALKLAIEALQEFAHIELAESEPPVATYRLESRLLRLEKLMTIMIEGQRICVDEINGWGITKDELEYIRHAYRQIREEHHFTNADLQRHDPDEPEDEKEQPEDNQEPEDKGPDDRPK